MKTTQPNKLKKMIYERFVKKLIKDKSPTKNYEKSCKFFFNKIACFKM